MHYKDMNNKQSHLGRGYQPEIQLGVNAQVGSSFDHSFVAENFPVAGNADEHHDVHQFTENLHQHSVTLTAFHFSCKHSNPVAATIQVKLTSYTCIVHSLTFKLNWLL
jgi:hypothetical protein